MKTYCFCILSLFCLLASAQAPRNFYMRFGGNGYDVGYDVKQTLDNGYIITGSTSSFGQGNTDLYLVKLDSMGNKKFEKSFGNYNNDIGKSVVQLTDSSYVTVGYTNSTGFGGYDIFLVKADKNGNLVWQKTIGGGDWDFAYSLQSTFDGGFVIAGTTYSFGRGNADGYVVKTDLNGDVEWTKTYGGTHDDEFKSIVQTSDGGFALTGYTKSYNDIDSGDVWVFKLDVMGDSLWCKFYGGSREDYGAGITQLQNTNITIAGGTKSESANGNMETLLLTFDNTNGTLMLHYADPSTHDEYYNDVVQGINGTIVGCGTTDNTAFGSQYDCLVDMYTASYGLLNFFGLGSSLNEEIFAISKTKDKGFVLVGITTSYNAVLDDVFFIKIDSLGNYSQNITSLASENISETSFYAYPNPANTGFYINMPHTNNFENIVVKVFDIQGQEVINSRLSDTNYIDTGNLSEAIYIIEVYRGYSMIGRSKISIIKY